MQATATSGNSTKSTETPVSKGFLVLIMLFDNTAVESHIQKTVREPE